MTVAFQLACFAVAWSLRADTLTDLAGSTNFIVLAVMTLLLGDHLTLRPVRSTFLPPHAAANGSSRPASTSGSILSNPFPLTSPR